MDGNGVGFCDRLTGADEWSARSSWLIAGLLFSSVVVLYWPAGRFGFVEIDDGLYVTENRHVRTGLSAANIRWAFFNGEAYLWHPLTWLSHMLDCQLYGLAPGGHHITSVLLHAANTVLVFAVLVRLTKASWPSVIVAALFGLHPLRVESVAWVAERKDVLSGLFFLLTLWAYAEHATRPSPRRLGLVALLFAAGLMAKPMLVTLPLLLLLLDYWPLRRFDAARPQTLLAEKLPLLGMATLASWVALLVGRATLSSVEDLSPASRLANAVVAYASYLGKTFWPSRLAVFYPMPVVTPVADILGSALLLGGITTFAIVARHRFPYVLIGWLWFVVALLPVSGLIQAGNQAMADRFTYLPSIGLFVALVWGSADLLRRWRVPAFLRAGGTIVILALLATTARAQLGSWTDTSTLCAHALRVTDLNWLAHNTLGHTLVQQGNLDEGISHLRASLQIKPNYPDALNNLGDALLRQGKTDEAASYFAAALRAQPDEALFAYNLGTALAHQGRIDEAADYFRAALRSRPDHAGALNNLGDALLHQGKTGEAASYFAAALRAQPDEASFAYNLGTALARLGRIDEAADYFRAALRLRPDYPDAHYNLGAALMLQGKSAEAMAQFKQTIEYEPAYAKAHLAIGNVLIQQGRGPDGLPYLTEALRLDPSLADAHFLLAQILSAQGNSDEAAAHFTQAVRLKPELADRIPRSEIVH